MENKTDCLIAKWLSEILKPDDTEKVGVYTAAFRSVFEKDFKVDQGKPPDPPGGDLTENEHQGQGARIMAVVARLKRSGRGRDFLPQRKPDCRFYDRCLDKAARQDASLECAACLRYCHQPFEHLDTKAELLPYLMLIHELFGQK